MNELDALTDSLKRESARLAAGIPEETDRAILAFIDDRAESIRGTRRTSRLVRYVGWATAAAIAAAVGVWTLSGGRQIPAVRSPAEDINQSGTVDILDAFLLARRIEDDGEKPAGWDVNRDGRVDQADVDLVAQRAVAVSKEGT